MKVQTIKKQVEMVFEDRTRIEGSVFLSPASAHRLGRESIGELLNGDRKYLPMETAGGELVLLSKNSIVMAFSREKESESMATSTKRIPAEVILRSGETIKGEVFNDLPMTYSRLSDSLNRSDVFFHIEVGARDCFVSNRYVRLIKPADPEEARSSKQSPA